MTDDHASEANGPEPGSLGLMREENLAERIEYEMRHRRWSQERLAAEMAKAGHPIHQSAISKIIKPKDGKRRTISVDEAIGFAKVFETSLEGLMSPMGAAFNQEIRKLMQDINHLTELRANLAKETNSLWDRLKDLLQDKEVVNRLTQDLKRFGYSHLDALAVIEGWLSEAAIRYQLADLRENAAEAGEEWHKLRDEQLELLDDLSKLIERIESKDPPTLDERKTITRAVRSTWITSRDLYTLLARRRGELTIPQGEIDSTREWIERAKRLLLEM
ncbi:helix-turn-helix domain-containing protein [Actinomadura macra]|uniref:helix-turn-helix domain-containing protein n=1 Tax=Actinomadura macra TaxID=46164 RepID=UPI000A866614|nr:helix-turn-helix transcriptional regulator [Actinomadura macra]